MKKAKYFVTALLIFAVTALTVSVPTSAHTVTAPQGSTAPERGYRTGYSDGYNAGYKDTADKAPRDYQNKGEYQKADRAYVDVWGPIEDYRDGYQQGYEAGYTAGYDHRQFDSSIPTGLKRRNNTADAQTTVQDNNNQTTNNSSTQTTTTAPSTTQSGNTSGTIFIPHDTMLVVELENPISTDVNQRGDPFQARIVEPREFAGAILEGHISRLQRAGKVKGTSELQLSFEQIRLSDNRRSSFHGEVVEVVAASSSSGVGEVDREGGVRGRDSTKDDVAKVGASAGVGAIIGAILGGGKGAAIGAAIGGGVATGGVLNSRGKEIRLEKGQQLRVRASTDTNVQ